MSRRKWFTNAKAAGRRLNNGVLKISEKQDIVPLAICMGNRKSASENVLIIIRINGAEIAVQSGTDAETLRSILSVMKSI